MTEITRVPLQPIAKGSLIKLWLGVIVALLVAFGVAHATRLAHFSDVTVTAIKDGTGPSPTISDVALINYVGRLTNGKVFDHGEKTPMPLQGVIPGFAQGLQKMKAGGTYRLEIPAALAYGAEAKRDASGQEVIPANSDLVFEVQLLGSMPAQQFQQMMMAEQARQAQSGAGSAPAPGAMPGQ
ncbi:MAG: FKBP-type peptidyl-prolyl cis-trans isomerase [Pseudomonadota bacterium]|nr:FKBP-type peptidyl-prolyl cis-trans isomerase [Pseudomonadota bacterium]